MVVAFDSPMPLGTFSIRLNDGTIMPYAIVREATYEEFLRDFHDPDINYPPSTLSKEEQLKSVEKSHNWFYEVAVD